VKKILIQFENIFKTFGANHVLQGVTLSIYKGEVTTIIGKSGVGKSVLLKHIIGLLYPDAGEIFLYGRPLSKKRFLRKRNPKTAYITNLN
jgi:phospholipid/cholesterol/gamma-HCH transport system ATP-binding protein